VRSLILKMILWVAKQLCTSEKVHHFVATLIPKEVRFYILADEVNSFILTCGDYDENLLDDLFYMILNSRGLPSKHSRSIEGRLFAIDALCSTVGMDISNMHRATRTVCTGGVITKMDKE